jgi:hypothetical protein
MPTFHLLLPSFCPLPPSAHGALISQPCNRNEIPSTKEARGGKAQDRSTARADRWTCQASAHGRVVCRTHYFPELSKCGAASAASLALRSLGASSRVPSPSGIHGSFLGTRRVDMGTQERTRDMVPSLEALTPTRKEMSTDDCNTEHRAKVS